MIRSLRSAFVLLVISAFFGCGDSSSGTTGVVDRLLPPIELADRIDVRRLDDREPLRQIAESSTIEQLLQFINSYPAVWSVPFAGPPVGEVYFDFYSQGQFVGNFYVGPGFFGRDLDGFFSISATDEEITTLSSIVGFEVLE